MNSKLSELQYSLVHHTSGVVMCMTARKNILRNKSGLVRKFVVTHYVLHTSVNSMIDIVISVYYYYYFNHQHFL